MEIRFHVPYHTEWGQQLFVCGSLQELGAGDPQNALRMQYVPADTWTTAIQVPVRRTNRFDYWYIVRHDDGRLLRAEPGPRTFLSPSEQEGAAADFCIVELRDSWRDAADPENAFLSSAFRGTIFCRDTAAGSFSARAKSGPSRVSGCLRLQIMAPRVDPGHELCVSGSCPVLGGWSPAKAVPMDGSKYPCWTLDLPLDDHPVCFHYKYMIRDAEGRLVFFEDGPNRYFASGEHAVPPTGDWRKVPQRRVIVTDEKIQYPNLWKGAGIAIPVFSLRSEHSLGVGEFLDLKRMVDWAAQCGFQLIQILPVNDTSVHGTWLDSYPYSGLSVFALHPLYLNLPAIGVLPREVQAEIDSQKIILNHDDGLDYEKVMVLKLRFLRKIFQEKKDEFLASGGFQSFLKENSFWLEPYAAFCYLRDLHGTSDYALWGQHSRVSRQDIRSLTAPSAPHHDQIAFYYFVQYHLHRQLEEVSQYARATRVVLKGDIPICLHKHSDSCWMHPEFFHTDQSAGAPPDPFSETGQNWEFPTYDWDAMARDGFGWWRERLRVMSGYFQMVRLDHVLGFFRIWEIPLESVSGLMGHFRPAIPLSEEELKAQGISDFDRLCEPYITPDLLEKLFGASSKAVAKKYLEGTAPGRYRLKPECRTQRQVQKMFAANGGDSEAEKQENRKILKGLFTPTENVILFRDLEASTPSFHPRINMMDTNSFSQLEPWTQENLKRLYIDYFYRRQEELWQRQGMVRLPVLKKASDMLICGEDLGMIPDCVPKVMEQLCLLGLRIQRMPKETDREFGRPWEYPYLTVSTPSSHDMPPIRGWWGEDPARSQRYHETVLCRAGKAPVKCTPDICRQIVVQHLESPSMWAVFPVQDILGMSERLCRPGDPKEEQINDPSDPHHRWKFRLHLTCERLISEREFNAEVREMVEGAGRGRSY